MSSPPKPEPGSESPPGVERDGPSSRQLSARLVLGVLAVIALVAAGFALGYVVSDSTEPSQVLPQAGSVDVGFCQDMSVHHAQAVEMATAEFAGGAGPAVKNLAFDILTTQQSQIGWMQGWLTVWGSPLLPTGPHMGWMPAASSTHHTMTGEQSPAGAASMAVMPGMAKNPFVDGPAAAAAAIRSAGRVRAYRLVWRAVRDKLRDRRGKDPLRVELAGPPDSVAMMTTPDAVAGFEAILPADPIGFEPAAPARIVLQMRADRPARRANLVTCPLPVCVSERDVIAPPQSAITVAERAPRGELRSYRIGHFDLFHHPWFDRVVGDQIAFLHRTLGETTTTGSELP